MAMSNAMKTSQLQNMTFDGSGAAIQSTSKLNSATAREHAPHLSASNKMEEHITPPGGKRGKLGAISHGGTD